VDAVPGSKMAASRPSSGNVTGSAPAGLLTEITPTPGPARVTCKAI